MTHDVVEKVIFQPLEGHLRSILGTLTEEEVNSERQSLAQNAARLQTILEKLPAIIEASSGVFAAVSAPLATSTSSW